MAKKTAIIFFFITCVSVCFSKIKKQTQIDVIIMCHEKDKDKVELSIDGIKKFGKNIRRIIVVSATKLTNKAEWFDEKRFPFYKQDIANEIFPDDQNEATLFAQSSRVGWIMKQLFNLYAAFVIPGISSNILAIDGDTIFLKPVEFIDAKGNALYNPGAEYYEPYFEHAAKLIAGPNQIKKVFPKYSGISHHMLFQKPILKELFKLIRQTHNIEPWKAMCRTLDKNEIYGSAIAEYEIYFNFVFARKKKVKIRKLKWRNIPFDNNLIAKYKDDFDYVSCHHYLRL